MSDGDALAQEMYDRLRRGYYPSCHAFLTELNANRYESQRKMLIDKLFELGLAHLTDRVAVEVTQHLLDT